MPVSLMLRRIGKYLLGLMVCLPLTLPAQQFIAAVSSARVELGQQFKITYTLNGQGSGFKAPTFENFRILSGPNQSTSMSWVNGQMSSSLSYSYILTPLKEGKLIIPPATITMNGNQVSSNEIKMEIVRGSSGNPQGGGSTQQGRGNAQQGGGTNAATNQAISDNVFIRCIPSKTKVYLGEQIMCEFKIYTKLQILDNGVDQLPSFNGFFSQDKELSQSDMSLHPEVYNGVQFQVATIKRVLLSPQYAGELPIDRLSMDLILRIQDNRRSKSIFDQFFGNFQDVRFKAVSNPVTIKVLALPETGKPNDFKGAVGKFGFEASVDRSELNVNDALNLKITFTGDGDLKLLPEPKLDLPGDFEIYDPKVSTDLKAGRKTIEYLIIPRAAGNFIIPQLTFSFFDPTTSLYSTLKAGPYNIVVSKGKQSDPVASVNRVSKKEVNLLGRDIRYIRTGMPNLQESRSYFFGTPEFYTLSVFPFGILMTALLLVRRRRLRNSDTLATKMRKAGKIATRRLAKASLLLRDKKMATFYEELLEALHGYLSDKLLIPRGELQRDNISTILSHKGVSIDVQQSLFSLLDECEMARYAPISGLDVEAIYEKAGVVINKLEEVLS